MANVTAWETHPMPMAIDYSMGCREKVLQPGSVAESIPGWKTTSADIKEPAEEVA